MEGIDGPAFANIPSWIIYAVGIAQIVFAISMAAVAAVLVMLIKQLIAILTDMKKMTEDVNRNLMPSVDGTLKNVKTMSDDVAVTVHGVTGTANRVSHVVGSVAGKMESPLIKGIGVASGLLAGARTLKGGKKQVVVEVAPKRRKLLGLF